MSIFKNKTLKSSKELALYKELDNIAYEIVNNNQNKRSALFNIEHDYTTIYLVGAPRHGNMGDHAIGTAMYSFVKRVIPNVQIMSIDCLTFHKNIEQLKKFVKPYDILAFYGGGNTGNQYYEEEFARQCLIQSFPNNMIILFPQTIYFIENSYGGVYWNSKMLREEYGYETGVDPSIGTAGEIKRFKEIYGGHKYLHVFARDKDSYDTLKLFIPDQHIYLVPDMVMSLDNLRFPKDDRVDATMCCRADCERVLSDDNHLSIKDLLGNYGKLKQIDTDIGFDIQARFSDNHLYELLMEFRKSKVVVTDRLHGLIFSAITGTPCVALGNYNAKTKGAYDWLKHLPYLDYCDNVSDLGAKLHKVTSCKTQYNSESISKAFGSLEQVLKDAQYITDMVRNILIHKKK